MKIAVIGAGWYGCHVSRVLSEKGYDVTLYEKNADIFSGISSKFGVKLHAGSHYPRSSETRKGCHQGLEEFCANYPELINQYEYSLCGLGDVDADGKPPKVDVEQFRLASDEVSASRAIEPEKEGYEHLLYAMEVDECGIAVGEKLRKFFSKILEETNVRLICNFEIKELKKMSNGILIGDGQEFEMYDYVVNTTSYQALLPEDSAPPFGMEVVYQPCLGLNYEDLKPNSLLPFSFLVMDGWFPCLMPYDEQAPFDSASRNKYIVTHGKWTVMGSFSNLCDAQQLLSKLDDEFIENQVKPRCEADLERFWPEFAGRFRYEGWKGCVLAKLKTSSEFRTAVTFEANNVVHVIPGKISNIFDVGREVISLINQEQTLIHGQYSFVENGVLHNSLREISEHPGDDSRNTCNLQTYEDIQREMRLEQKVPNELQSKQNLRYLSSAQPWQKRRKAENERLPS